MDSITRFSAQMTATHPVVLLQMPDRRFNRFPTLEQLELFFVQPLRFAPVIDLNARVLLIDPAVSEINIHRGRLDSVVLQQDRRLLDLFSQRMPIKGITAKRSRTLPTGGADRSFDQGGYGKNLRRPTSAKLPENRV
jgi:hypothetical protein